MKRDGAAAFAMRDFDLEAEQVAKLAFEGGEIGVNRAIAGAIACSRAGGFCGARKLFDLTDRKPVADDAVCNLGCQRRGGDGAGVAHADVAAHEQGANVFG